MMLLWKPWLLCMKGQSPISREPYRFADASVIGKSRFLQDTLNCASIQRKGQIALLREQLCAERQRNAELVVTLKAARKRPSPLWRSW